MPKKAESKKAPKKEEEVLNEDEEIVEDEDNEEVEEDEEEVEEVEETEDEGESEDPAEPVEEAPKGPSVTVVDTKTGYTRTYSKETHGADFKKLAESYKGKSETRKYVK